VPIIDVIVRVGEKASFVLPVLLPIARKILEVLAG
jgi:hypothetical protein